MSWYRDLLGVYGVSRGLGAMRYAGGAFGVDGECLETLIRLYVRAGRSAVPGVCRDVTVM